ncbi:MAG: hypothetical protein H7301_07490, partial [Cryobacterium sp.]|nr:hypothetical protein [Oligoflexia bacterium]
MKAPLRVLVLRSFRSPLQAVGSLAFFLLTVLSILILILIPRFVAPLRIPYLPLQMAA